jgi:hypothetical protein
MTQKRNTKIADFLWFLPVVSAVLAGVGLASRHDDPIAIAAGTGAALAVGLIIALVGRWLVR